MSPSACDELMESEPRLRVSTNLLKSSAVNPLFRGLYKIFRVVDRVFRVKLLGRFRVSGTVHLNFQNHEFQMFSAWDDNIVDMLYFKEREYTELTELGMFSALARDSKVILDIGANTGLYSIISATANPDAEITGFEPYSVNYARLQKNLGINKLQKTRAVNLALGDSDRPPIVVPPTVLVQPPPEAWGEGRRVSGVSGRPDRAGSLPEPGAGSPESYEDGWCCTRAATVR